MAEYITGRPTLYDPDYCNQIIEYFDIEPYREERLEIKYKDGHTEEKIQLIANDLPTIEGFAKKIKVHIDTIAEWRKVHKEFSVAIAQCKAIQKSILITNGLKGLYQSNYAIFATSNLTEFRHKKDITGNIKKKIKYEGHALDDLIKKVEGLESNIQPDIKDK